MKIKKVIRFIARSPLCIIRNSIASVVLLVMLSHWGTVELVKVIKRNPMRTIFVIGITSAFTVMGISILMGEELQVLPVGLRIMTMCGIGLGSLVGSISFSQRVISK